MGSTAVILPLTDKASQRVCALSGTEQQIYAQKLIGLQQVKKDIIETRRQAFAAKSNSEMVEFLALGLRLTKLACDLTVTILSKSTGPAGTVISAVYDRSALVVSGITGELDEKGVYENMISGKISISENMAEMAGKERLAKIIGNAGILFTIYTQHKDIIKQAREFWNAGSYADGILKGSLSQLEKVQHKIEEIEAELQACGLS